MDTAFIAASYLRNTLISSGWHEMQWKAVYFSLNKRNCDLTEVDKLYLVSKISKITKKFNFGGLLIK